MACKVLKFSRSNSNNSNPAQRICEYGAAGADYLVLKPVDFIDFEVDFSLVYYGTTSPTSQIICMGVSNPDLTQPIVENECSLIRLRGSQMSLYDGLGNLYSVTFTNILINGEFYRFVLNSTGLSLYQNGGVIEDIPWDNPLITFTPNAHGFYFGYPLAHPVSVLNTDFGLGDRGSLNCALCEFKITANQEITLHVKFGEGYPGPTILSEVGSDVSLYNFGSRLQFGKQDAYVDNDYCCFPTCTTGTYQILITGIAPGNPTFSFSSSLTTDEVDLTKFEDCSGYIIPTTEEQISQFLTEGTNVTFTPEGALLEITFTTTEECNTYNVNITGDFFCAKVIGVPKCCVREYDVTSTTRACCVELTEAQAKINTIHEFVLNNFGFTNINKLIGFSKIGASKYEEYLKALDELKDFVLFISLIYSDMACTGNSYTSYISDSEIQKFIDKFYCYNIDIKCILQMANIGNYTGCCEEVTHDTTCPCVDEVPTALPTRFITFNVNSGDIEQINTEPVTFACCSGDSTVRAIKAKTSSGMPFTAAFEQYVQIGMYTLVINFDSDSDFAIEGTNGEINVTLSVCGKTVTQKYIINVINTCVDEYPNPLPLVTIPEIDLYTAVDNSTVGIISVFDPFSCCTTPPENPAEQTWEITGITIPSGSGFTYAPNLIGTTGTGNTASVTLGFNIEDANTGADQIYIYYLLCGKYSIRQDVAFSIIDSCDTLPAPVITLDPPVDTTIDFNTVGETLVYTLDGLPEACCDDELITVEFVAILPTVDTPNPAAFNITIDTSNAPTSISVIYSGHSVSDLVASDSFKYKIKLNVCGKEVTVTPNLTFNFVGNCLDCRQSLPTETTDPFVNSAKLEESSNDVFSFNKEGSADLEVYDTGVFGSSVFLTYFFGNSPNGICLVGEEVSNADISYASILVQKETNHADAVITRPALSTPTPYGSVSSRFTIEGIQGNDFEPGAGVTVVSNKYYHNVSGVLFLKNLVGSRKFSIGKMANTDISPFSESMVYKAICLDSNFLPINHNYKFPIFLPSTYAFSSVLDPDYVDFKVGDQLVCVPIMLAGKGIYAIRVKMTISGVIDVTNVTHGISIYGRLLSKTSNNTCIFSSGQDKTEAGDIYTAPVSISDLAKKGVIGFTTLNTTTLNPVANNYTSADLPYLYDSDEDGYIGENLSANIPGERIAFNEGGGPYETYLVSEVKTPATNCLFVLNLATTHDSDFATLFNGTVLQDLEISIDVLTFTPA